MTRYARAGERVYGTRTNAKGQAEDFHICTVRHDLFLGELPDFPACLGDWQQTNPPVGRHYITQLENVYTTRTDIALNEGTQSGFTYSTATATGTITTFIDLAQHGGGEAPMFGVPWSGESWWRIHDHGGTRASLHYDLRFRAPNGTCTWRMDELEGKE